MWLAMINERESQPHPRHSDFQNAYLIFILSLEMRSECFEGNTPVRGGRGESKAQLNTKLGLSLRRGLQGVKWRLERHRGVMDGNDN